MNKVFEKIIEKQEELFQDLNVIEVLSHVDFDSTIQNSLENFLKAITNEAIEIVKQEAEQYEECQGCKQNAVDKYTRMTQSDRIRSMSDEELADYIFGVSVHEKPCVLCSDDCDFCELTDEECKNRTLEWLQSEVEE